MPPRVLKIKVTLASARPALLALRRVEGVVYKREGGSYAITLEPGDVRATARLAYQLIDLGITLGKLPKAVERAYERLLREEPPKLLVDEGTGDDDSDEATEPVDQASVVHALVEHADPSSIF